MTLANVLKMMNRLGMLADLSHVGKKTTMDIIRLSEKPVAVTHAGVYNITPSVRTKTDEEMLAIKENGGVMGISPWAPLIWKKEKGCRPDVKDYVDHVDYVVNLIGIDHVSFGADNTLDGNKDDKGTADQAVLYPAVVGAYNSCVGTRSDERHAKGFEGCWQLENVMDEMKRRGYSEEDIAKLTGKNLLRVLRAKSFDDILKTRIIRPSLTAGCRRGLTLPLQRRRRNGRRLLMISCQRPKNLQR